MDSTDFTCFLLWANANGRVIGTKRRRSRRERGITRVGQKPQECRRRRRLWRGLGRADKNWEFIVRTSSFLRESRECGGGTGRRTRTEPWFTKRTSTNDTHYLYSMMLVDSGKNIFRDPQVSWLLCSIVLTNDITGVGAPRGGVVVE